MAVLSIKQANTAAKQSCEGEGVLLVIQGSRLKVLFIFCIDGVR